MHAMNYNVCHDEYVHKLVYSIISTLFNVVKGQMEKIIINHGLLKCANTAKSGAMESRDINFSVGCANSIDLL